MSLPNLRLGSPDSVWMAHIAATGLIAVTRDRRINRNSAERELIRSAGLKVVWLTGRSDMRSSEQAALFRVKVSATCAYGEDLGDGPWGLGLSAKGRLRVIRLTSGFSQMTLSVITPLRFSNQGAEGAESVAQRVRNLCRGRGHGTR